MEMPVLLTESEANSLLLLLKSFETLGFYLPVPNFARAKEHSLGFFVLVSRLDLGAISVVATASIDKQGRHSPLSRGIMVQENNGKAGGRSEIVLVSAPGKATYVFTAKIGKDASLDMIRLCGRLNVNRLIVTNVSDIEEKVAVAGYAAIARWTNELVAAQPKVETPERK